MAQPPNSDRTREEHLQRLATLGTLAASSAHEVNNIVTQLLAMLHHAADAAGHLDSEEAHKWREKLHDALGTGQLCCERLLDLARGMTHCAKAPTSELLIVEITDVIDQAIEIVRPELRAAAVIDRVYASALPPIRGNPGKLCQVFVNLLLNAAHAVRSHRSRRDHCVTIDARLVDGWVWVDVCDTGPGLAPEVAQRVFEPFFTTKSPEVGTGLGLSVSRTIVHEHGGEILAGNAPGKGALFSIRLPPA